ncbi:hypothetical protein EYC59_05170 [Candidatus Saccharibacteria bacterium]|nr:MAG: hypothetical protein EYC59_05170 [Candidatus Saccharibacteria bacterium]
MTYHDPIQGILTCQPKTVLRRTATSIRLQGGNPRRNDRLQGILFNTTPLQTRPFRAPQTAKALPEFIPGTIIPPLAIENLPKNVETTEKPAAIDDLTLDEFDEVYMHSLLQSRQTATVVKENRRLLIHNIRLPLRRDK